MSNRKNFVTFSIPLVILTLLTILCPLGQPTYVAAHKSGHHSNSNSNDNSDHSSDSGSGSHSGIVDSACRMINNHPGAATLLGHFLGLGSAGTIAQGYCGLR
jgi:hypothetical protein